MMIREYDLTQQQDDQEESLPEVLSDLTEAMYRLDEAIMILVMRDSA